MSTPSSDYHSSISSRENFGRTSMQRQSVGQPGGRTLKIVTEMGASSVSGISPSMGKDAAHSIIESRDREKREMQGLNTRLGAYIDRVASLETTNRKLADDLDGLRNRWGKDTASIKHTYDQELGEARRLMDDTAKGKADAEVSVSRLQLELNDIRLLTELAQDMRTHDKDNYESYANELNNAQMELDQLKRRLDGITEEEGRYRTDNDRLTKELQDVRNSLDQETVMRIDFQNQVQTIMEEIEFMRRIHDQEIKELEALMSKETPANTRDYFKNELSLAIRDIRGEYDQIAHQTKTDMESWYKMKVQEVSTATNQESMQATFTREETTRLRNQLGDTRGKLQDLESKNQMLEKQLQELQVQMDDDQRTYEAAVNDRDHQIRKMREETQALMMELQSLMDTKQIMDAEIAIYRRMLESEESRGGLKSLVETVVKQKGLQQHGEVDSQSQIRGEVSQKTSFQRSAKGNVAIAEAEAFGKWITLENTNKNKDEVMEEWTLKRKVDGKKDLVYVFPKGYTLRGGKSVRIFAKGAGVKPMKDDLVFDGADSWGVGQVVATTLFNKAGEERATHVQRTEG